MIHSCNVINKCQWNVMVVMRMPLYHGAVTNVWQDVTNQIQLIMFIQLVLRVYYSHNFLCLSGKICEQIITDWKHQIKHFSQQITF